MSDDRFDRVIGELAASLERIRAELAELKARTASREQLAALEARLEALEQTAPPPAAAPVKIPDSLPSPPPLAPSAPILSEAPTAPPPAWPSPPATPEPQTPAKPSAPPLPAPTAPEARWAEAAPPALTIPSPSELPKLPEVLPPAPAAATPPVTPRPAATPPIKPPRPAAPPRTTTPRPPLPPRPPRKPLDWGELESKLAVWGTRVGAFIVVLGLGYLMSIGFGKLDLLGKTVVVYAACLAMWGAGLLFERKERYSTWGKILIAGGWAGVYITTFLIHYLPAARVIADPALDTYLLSAIAVGMIAHSFKYKSQSLTTLTYFIAFITIALSIQLAHQTFYSLVAAAVLAISMLIIFSRMQWHWLAFFSLFACYGTHSIWLTPLAAAFHAPGGHTLEFWSGLAMLALYWLTFTAAVFLTRPSNWKEAGLVPWMTALNYVLFVAVFRWHMGSNHPEWRWYFTGTMALIYALLSYLTYSTKRPNLYTLNLVIATLSLTMTLYFRLLGGGWLSVAWLLEAEALYAAGRLADEKRFRWIAIANFVLVGAWVLLKDLFLPDQLSLLGLIFYKRTAIFATIAAVFYLNAGARYFMAHRFKSEEKYSFVFSYAASALWLILTIRNWVPDDLLVAAVAGAVLALALMEAGIRAADPHFRAQGLFYAFLAVFAALVPLIGADHFYYHHGLYYRIGCEAAVIIFAYVAFARFSKLHAQETSPRGIEAVAADLSDERLGWGARTAAAWVDFPRLTPLLGWFAGVLLVLLIEREVWPRWPAWVQLFWMAPLLVFFGIGRRRRDRHFLLQSLTVAAAILVWTLVAAIPPLAPAGRLAEMEAQRVFAVAPVIVLFYGLFALLLRRGEKLLGSDLARFVDLARDGLSWGGTIVLVALVTVEVNEVSRALTTVLWLALAVALYEIGRGLANDSIKVQAVLLAAVGFVRTMAVNFREPFGPVWFMSGRAASMIAVAAGLYYLYLRLYRSGEKTFGFEDRSSGSGLSWLGLAVVGMLLYREIRPEAAIAPAWAGLMLATLVPWLGLRDRSQLGQALAMLIPVLGGVLAWDFPEHGTWNARLAVGLALGALFTARVILHLAPTHFPEALKDDKDARLFAAGRHLFALPAAALLTLYVIIDAHGAGAQYLTIALAGDGLFILLLGFAVKDRILRFSGLGILAACIVKVFYDLWRLHIDRIYKVIALIGLGLILILIGWLYARFSAQIKKMFAD